MTRKQGCAFGRRRNFGVGRIALFGSMYARREPEKTALFQVIQQHLLTFEQRWTDQADGRTLPSFVTNELHDFLGCGILARGLAQLFCSTCHEFAQKKILARAS
jgi:hypothetical protein